MYKMNTLSNLAISGCHMSRLFQIPVPSHYNTLQTIVQIPEDISEDENYNEESEYFGSRPTQKFWSGEERVYHKSKLRQNCITHDLKSTHDSDEFISSDSNWDNLFPALSAKTHNAFTLSSDRSCDKKNTYEASQKSGGDTVIKVLNQLLRFLDSLFN